MSELSGELPWGWFAALGLVDAALAWMWLRRRRENRRHADARATQAPGSDSVLCHGWRVPRARAEAVQVRPTAIDWTWQVHHEPLRRTVGRPASTAVV